MIINNNKWVWLVGLALCLSIQCPVASAANGEKNLSPKGDDAQIAILVNQSKAFSERLSKIENSYNENRVVIEISRMNAQTAQYVIWFITTISILIALGSFLGLRNVSVQGKEAILKIQQDHEKIFVEIGQHVKEIRDSKEQLDQLKKYISLAAELNEITPKKIEQQISSTIEDRTKKISQELTELKGKNIPIEANIYTNLGRMFYTSKNYEQAISSYQKALEINPNSMNARFGLALTYSRHYNLENMRANAILQYEQLLRLYPGDIDSATNVMELYIINGDLQKFDEMVNKIISDFGGKLNVRQVFRLDFLKLSADALKNKRLDRIKLVEIIDRLAKSDDTKPMENFVYDLNDSLQKVLAGDSFAVFLDFENVLSGKLTTAEFKIKWPS